MGGAPNKRQNGFPHRDDREGYSGELFTVLMGLTQNSLLLLLVVGLSRNADTLVKKKKLLLDDMG